MKRLGIMQGRLLPPIKNQVQAFPGLNWADEFPRCQKLGLSSMEWGFDYYTLYDNPLYSDEGIDDIIKTSKHYNVSIDSVVANYFMVKKLFGDNEDETTDAIGMLNSLIVQCHKCGISIIVIPLVDSSALKTETDKRQLVQNMEEPLRLAGEHDIRISLETSLPPGEFKNLILAFSPFNVYVNYDMGNSASLGYNPIEEISLLADYIINIHIKDRIMGGGTVPLGKGDVDFKAVFNTLKQSKYSGDFILEAARQDLSGEKNKRDTMETVRDYIDFAKPYIDLVP